MFGVDEAGRGPVLGSMFVSCVQGPHEAIPDDVDDSKTLSYKKVHRLAGEIRSDPRLDTKVIEVKVHEIDDSKSLTQISATAYAEAINACTSGSETGIIDAFTRNLDEAEKSVQQEVEEDIQITAEFSADENHAHVSAASILAKSARENHVSELKSEFGEIGSGYPSDTTTRRFLETFVSTNGELPKCARASWSTSEKILSEFA